MFSYLTTQILAKNDKISDLRFWILEWSGQQGEPTGHINRTTMGKEIFERKRKSYMDIGKIYFWAATINNWQRLLLTDGYKNIVVGSLEHLSNSEKLMFSPL